METPSREPVLPDHLASPGPGARTDLKKAGLTGTGMGVGIGLGL